MSRTHRVIAGCLAGVVVSLLLVGVVSGTVLRHVVQVVPAVVAFGVLMRRPSWGPSASLAIFGFWLFIMSLIWLYLLGLANIVTGKFTTAEIFLTLVIGLCCVAGTAAWFLSPGMNSRLRSFLIFAVFLALQIGAMWLSLQKEFANR